MPSIIRDIFEQEFTKMVSCSSSIAVNSGTSALIAPLWSMDLMPDDEVITTPFTFIATSNAIIIAGAKPVFVDIDPESFLIDPSLIEDKITDKTRAIIPVHLFGKMCNMDIIMDIAKRHSLIVIEDSAQALGATTPSGDWAGTIGDFGTFSFYKTKNLSTFEGGMITINKDCKLDSAKVRSITDQGQQGKYNHEYIGFNFRMPEPCALIGLEAIKIHMTGVVAELGMRGVKDGHYPKVSYHQPCYERLGITGDCPVAESVAERIRNRS